MLDSPITNASVNQNDPQSENSRVKCTTCGNSWFQSRERLFPIPRETHEMLPALQSDLDRIASNLARDYPPEYRGMGKLYVGNLDYSTTSEDLREFFETKVEEGEGTGKGGVCDASVVVGADGRSRGFGFVSFYSESDSKAGLTGDGQEINGREAAVREPNN